MSKAINIPIEYDIIMPEGFPSADYFFNIVSFKSTRILKWKSTFPIKQKLCDKLIFDITAKTALYTAKKKVTIVFSEIEFTPILLPPCTNNRKACFCIIDGSPNKITISLITFVISKIQPDNFVLNPSVNGVSISGSDLNYDCSSESAPGEKTVVIDYKKNGLSLFSVQKMTFKIFSGKIPKIDNTAKSFDIVTNVEWQYDFAKHFTELTKDNFNNFKFKLKSNPQKPQMILETSDIPLVKIKWMAVPKHPNTITFQLEVKIN